MNPLIPIHEHVIGGRSQKCVDARDLWAFFRPRSPFASWMYNKLLQHHNLAENSHYVTVKVMREISYGSHTRVSHQVDYFLSIEMAEAIGAVEYCRGLVEWNK